MTTEPNLGRALNALRAGRKIVAFSGAGISAESGIATYRDKLTGLWSHYRPETLETARAFKENPPLVWGWYLWRRALVARAEPNAAHRAINRLATPSRSVSVITQNIDDLHERGGTADVIHLHGSLAIPKCFACHRYARLSSEQFEVPIEGALIEPPRCERCNGRLRPGVVWYEEDLPQQAWRSAVALVKTCDVLISVGTSGKVMPAAGLPDMALACGATVVHVNTQDVSLEGKNEIMLIGKASQILPALASQI
ncbi:SIR2 family NAD-dependent protein deacylase [Pseudomonas sp. NPDC090202]|uniref:SIR2 family NAD-dependent protein deacylase n=1 Tax=Pseudomonas sp. NPDC090202 TaxID=3364476 RepID=UPI0038195361